MRPKNLIRCALLLVGLIISVPYAVQAQDQAPSTFSFSLGGVGLSLFGLLLILLLFAARSIFKRVKGLRFKEGLKFTEKEREKFTTYLDTLNSQQIDSYLHRLRSGKDKNNLKLLQVVFLTFALWSISCFSASAQTSSVKDSGVLGEGGIIITMVLISIPIIAGIFIMIIKVMNGLNGYKNKQREEEAERFATYLKALPEDEVKAALIKRKQALDYKLTDHELSGNEIAYDEKGLVSINKELGLPVVSLKKKAIKRPNIDPDLAKLILWFFGTATFWLVFGTTVGEYLGIKFVAPDADHISWLSFGRLRPVHTNAVFWGWASLAMLGLGHYIVPRVSNVQLFSVKLGWWTLWLINITVVLGSLCLMAGINNGGGEYREYIWPVMLLFGVALFLTLINFLKTIARRTTREIYIANWYIVASVIFAIVISLVAYIPIWQDGLGETIVQGYYMHQGVGMWFMLFTLGIVYYFLPQQLNKPIYSYSLGILAFWTQILFYTLIGTHHFVFSAIPWWLQTVAIIGSMGMVIPVVAGTTNFIMTFKGAWYKIKSSYTLPFFLVGIIFYFTGSLQGTAEAFRSTNLIWHFTDFTVAHSHLTMYGIICFFVWAGIYALVPRLTGKEAPQITIGAHFWLALIGLMFYTIPLMYGSTLKGLMWMQNKPFLDSVIMMAPFWLWRAIGGSLMWCSHIFFAYNLYKMISLGNIVDVRQEAITQLDKDETINNPSAQ
ncbi:cytochrome c oxidase cbb3-type subunit 1 [Pedobacter sp. UYP30]|uniref:cbb3-type cytochrome c oxidase subunit I n=1 Tax=Pedobacter sp. UYP30 TaxID=1756400 RepID=UPI003393BC9B